MKQVKLWTILARCLYLFVQNWKCRTSTKGTKVPSGHPPLPLSHPPVRNEELRLSLLLAHSIANVEKRLFSACASCLPYFAVGWLVLHSSHRIAGSVRSEQFSSCDCWHLSTALSIAWTRRVIQFVQGHWSLAMCSLFSFACF